MQLGLDSLDAMEVTLAVEQRFGFTGEQVPTTLGQLLGAGGGLAGEGAAEAAAGRVVRPADRRRAARDPRARRSPRRS